MSNSNSLNIPLTDEMKRFITAQTGNGTLYSTPSEYVRDLIRHDKERKEAAELRSSIIEGYKDVLHGRVQKFSGDLRADLENFKNKTK